MTALEAVKDKLRSSGITNAAGALITFRNGDVVLMISADNPNGNRTDAIAEIELKQSARASGSCWAGSAGYQVAYVALPTGCSYCGRRNDPNKYNCQGCGAAV